MPLTGEYEPGTLPWVREQVEEFESSNGAKANTILGRPIVVITSLGARSGKLRKTPVMRVEHGGEYLMVASLGGAEKNPTWYANVKKHPIVELQDGPVRKDFSARELSGEEKALWWARAVEAFSDYADYQAKTTREIPVFLLSPL